MLSHLWLVPVGFGVGLYGTLIGAGGGFVLMPLLLLLYPQDSPELLTSISLAVVFFNALSGSVAYARMRRIDYPSGGLFAAATVPGAVLGALTTAHVARRTFEVVLGVVMAAAGGWLLLARPREPRAGRGLGRRRVRRRLVDATGRAYTYAIDPWLGVATSLAVGYLSSLLGIGGGIIHVPLLSQLLGFPVHVATATSHFVLAVMAFAGTAVHVATGTFRAGLRRTIALAIGVVIGAQLGARVSSRVRATWILRALGLALGLVGVRLLFGVR